MKKCFVLWSFLVIISILSACQSNQANVPKEKDLEIAIIGEIPDIQEENINFTGIDFEEIEKDDFHYDAVFVMEDYLEVAAKKVNVERFKNSSKPTFFIGTKASYFPFIESEKPLSYEDYAKRLDIPNYEVAGIIYVNGDTGYRSFIIDAPVGEESLSNDKKDKIFLEVFQAIRKNKLHKEDPMNG